VDPASFDTLCAAIEGLGWSRRVVPMLAPRAADLVFVHSATFIHPQWPCDLDVHFSFPGFLTDAPAAFEALWQTRTRVAVASVGVSTPGLTGQALVVGLHALRDANRPASQDDLAHLAALLPQALDDSGRAALAELAVAAGAQESARAILECAGVDLAPPGPETPALRAWRVRQEFAPIPGSMWWVELRRARWRERPRILTRAVFFPRELLVGTESDSASRTRIAQLHLRRWGRGLRALPHALRILGRVDRSADD
jgi:hypothetical protein